MMSEFLALILLLTAAWICLATLGCTVYEGLADDGPGALDLNGPLKGDAPYEDEQSRNAVVDNSIVAKSGQGTEEVGSADGRG